MPSSAWQPLLAEPARRARAIDAGRALVAGLAAGAHRLREPRPLLERAVLLSWASASEALALDLDLPALATDCLRRRIELIGRDAEPASLFGGLAGLGWALAQLVDADDGEDPCAPILDRLVELAADPAQRRDYDLVGGLVGFGVAGLARVGSPAGRRLIGAVLDGLAQASPGWLTAPEVLPDWKRAQTPAGRHDLGVAHGAAGAIALLARLVEHDEPRARPLLDGAVAHLLAAAPPDPAGRFPPWLPGGTHRTRGRLAWCTGDLGIACALLAAADAAAQPAWRAEALALARSAARRSTAEAGVRDAGLCHGAAGVAHLFNRLWQATGEPALQRAATAWLDRLLAMPPAEDATLTTGAAGVALVLLAAATPVEPAWDQLFLVDLGS